MRSARLALVAVVLVAGCGDSGAEQAEPTSTATTTAPPSQTDWAAKADAICVAYQARIDALPAPQTQGEAVTALRDTVTLARDELRALDGLTPSPPERARVKRFLAQLRAVIAATERLAEAAAAADESAQAAALAAGEEAASEAQTMADSLGLTACGAG